MFTRMRYINSHLTAAVVVPSLFPIHSGSCNHTAMQWSTDVVSSCLLRAAQCAMWRRHQITPMNRRTVMHSTLSATDHPERKQLAHRMTTGTDASTCCDRVATSAAKLTSFVVGCGVNGAHELKKIALGG